MSHDTKAKKTRVGLPYINNLPIILIVAAINLAVGFIFYYGASVTAYDFVTDATICGFTTVLISAAYVNWAIGKMRSKGALPCSIPDNHIIQRFPKNPIAFALIMAVLFSVLMALASSVFNSFYSIQDYTFARYAVLKVLYSCILSAKIMELVILRFIQPDCARPDDPPQTGTDVVKNPIPSKETFGKLFNTVKTDFGFGMLFGLVLGGTKVVDSQVVISATTRSGIIIGGLITGFIITLLMIRPVAKQMRQARLAGELPIIDKRIPLIAWLPGKPMLFALVLMLPTMVITAAVLWSVLTFFGLETLNFFQFYVIRTIYTTLLTKVVVQLAVLRYIQPDKTVAQAEEGRSQHV